MVTASKSNIVLSDEHITGITNALTDILESYLELLTIDTLPIYKAGILLLKSIITIDALKEETQDEDEHVIIIREILQLVAALNHIRLSSEKQDVSTLASQLASSVDSISTIMMIHSLKNGIKKDQAISSISKDTFEKPIELQSASNALHICVENMIDAYMLMIRESRIAPYELAYQEQYEQQIGNTTLSTYTKRQTYQESKSSDVSDNKLNSSKLISSKLDSSKLDSSKLSSATSNVSDKNSSNSSTSKVSQQYTSQFINDIKQQCETYLQKIPTTHQLYSTQSINSYLGDQYTFTYQHSLIHTLTNAFVTQFGMRVNALRQSCSLPPIEIITIDNPKQCKDIELHTSIMHAANKHINTVAKQSIRSNVNAPLIELYSGVDIVSSEHNLTPESLADRIFRAYCSQWQVLGEYGKDMHLKAILSPKNTLHLIGYLYVQSTMHKYIEKSIVSRYDVSSTMILY